MKQTKRQMESYHTYEAFIISELLQIYLLKLKYTIMLYYF